MRHAVAEFTFPAQSSARLQLRMSLNENTALGHRRLRSFGGVRSDAIADVSHASRRAEELRDVRNRSESAMEDVGVVGATLLIVDGPNAGRSVTTVDGGRYALKDLVESRFIVHVSAPNYLSTDYSLITLRGDLRVDFMLSPTP